jgi:hypothetical protein
MSRLSLPIWILALAASPGFAQSPPPIQVTYGAAKQTTQPAQAPQQPPAQSAAPGLLPVALTENRTKFNTESVEVKQNGLRWQIWDGKTLVRDFADNREGAFEARRLIADLKLSERAMIGTPEPVMEYWLASGEAPHVPMLARHIVPFDAGSLKVDRMNDNYVLRDVRQVLYNFGPYAADAKQALAVMQKYQFNELGLIGSPRPSMTYLIRNERLHSGLVSGDVPFQPMLLPQQTPRHPLILPKLGTVGERTPFDPLRTDIHKAADGWHLVAGPHDLVRLGQGDYAARQALLTVQRYPMNEYVRVGTAGYGFFLSRGQAPRGVPIGIRSTAFDPAALAVKPDGDHLSLTDGRHVLTTFPSNQPTEAALALSVVKHYGFDAQCEVGGLKFLAKDR